MREYFLTHLTLIAAIITLGLAVVLMLMESIASLTFLRLLRKCHPFFWHDAFHDLPLGLVRLNLGYLNSARKVCAVAEELGDQCVVELCNRYERPIGRLQLAAWIAVGITASLIVVGGLR